MVVQALTEDMIKAGAELTRRLDEKTSVEAALWFLLAETSTWRLIFCIPTTDTLGPKKIYSVIQGALSKKGVEPLNLSLADISLMSPSHPLIQLLRVAVRTGPAISGIRFTRNTINGHFIEDAHIYRMNIGPQQSVQPDSPVSGGIAG